MTFEEALAVYLYLQHASPGTRDEKLFALAWGVICERAERTIRTHTK
jgi:hypothetical protein